MNEVLNLLLEGEHLSSSKIGEILGLSDSEVEHEMTRLQREGILLGWRPVLNSDQAASDLVRAVIEVKISPEREGGFDRTAERISGFEEVESCYLMSGAYDLLVFVRGANLHEVATFVSERLATIGGVLSTATHFLLRTYKDQGFLLGRKVSDADKPAVSP